MNKGGKLQKNCGAASMGGNKVEPLFSDTSLIRTPLYYGQFPMPRQNSQMFS